MTNVISDDEIKERLINMYVRRFGADIDVTRNRKLLKFEHNDCYTRVGSILYSLEGSPPKGYVLYVPERKELLFLHSDLKRSGSLVSCIIKNDGEE